jgi:hypothetical protein
MKNPKPGDVGQLDRDCEIGSNGERAVVLALDGKYMTLVFPNRDVGRRVMYTGSDYLYLKRI